MSDQLQTAPTGGDAGVLPENSTMRDAIERAFAESEAKASTPEAAPKSDPGKAEAAQSGRKRDASGKFAPDANPYIARPETDDAAKETPEPEGQEGDGQQAATPKLQPPVSWTAEEKAEWDALSPRAQQAVLRREREVARGFEDKAKQYAPIENTYRAINEVEPLLRKYGQTPESYIRTMNGWLQSLETDPQATIAQIANRYGVNLNQPPANQAADQFVHPVISNLQQELAQVKAVIAAQREAEMQNQTSTIDRQIQDFAANPAHPHFEAVKGTMAQLLEGKLAADLGQAYQMAVRLNDDLAKQDAAARDAERQKAQAEAVKKAKSAAVSLPSASPRGSTKAPDSIRDAIDLAFGDVG